MAKHSNIEWTDASWNPWTGCHKVSAGCDNCYMHREKKRFGQDPIKIIRTSGITFLAPLRWKEPLRIMVCSWSDFLIEEADPWRVAALDIMAACPQHIFIIPTKRPERIIDCLYEKTGNYYLGGGDHMSNVWFLASVENQETADKRIPELLKLRKSAEWPVLGISAEPLLGAIDLSFLPECGAELDWIIAGGESGSNARPCHPDWIRLLREQSKRAGKPFFFKQWGEFHQISDLMRLKKPYIKLPHYHFDPDCTVVKVGKKKAGRLLDGREWNQFPE